MISKAIGWLEGSWWGGLLALAGLTASAYLSIWAVIEPLSVPDSISTDLLPRQRWVYHIIFAVLLGALLTIVLDAWVRRKRGKAIFSSMPHAPFEKGYEITAAKDFYDRIAPEYDKRNSSSLLHTHQQVISVIKQVIGEEQTSVLDLGGGTGKLIAHHFFDRNNLHWDYVDFSPVMVEQFRSNMAGTTLQWHAEMDSIERLLQRSDKSYDVVILSLVLTSMERNPDWQLIAKRLRPRGRLIVADIDAAYTAIHPYYVVQLGANRHGLKPRAVALTQLIHETRQAGLRLQHSTPIMDGRMNYAYVAEFQRA